MSSNYWKQRIEQQRLKALHRTVKETDEQLTLLYNEQAEKLYDELLRVLVKMENDSADGKLYINDLYRTNRLGQLVHQFNKTAAKLGGKQIEITEKALIGAYEKSQKIVEANVPKRLLPVYSQFVRPSAIPTEQIINQVWCLDGLNFSDRIWKNKEHLVKDLYKSLGDSIMRGKGSYEVAKGVAARLDVDKASAIKVVRTETAHCQIVAQKNKYKDMGFTHCRFNAQDPCDKCAELDGQLFTLDEIESIIPVHPNCECSFLLEV